MISLVLTALVLAAGPAQQCVGSPSAPALDHVVVVVRDLEAASAGFRSAGFVLKPGRLHANNLLNRHVKFRDGSSIELMTVRGTPGDAMARDYAALAAAGEGGVYVALRVGGVEEARAAANTLGLAVQESSSGPWRFLSYPDTSPAAAVFFSAGSAVVQDPDSLLNHVPAVEGLAEAWLEGGSELADLLDRLGARRCGTVTSPDGRTGERMALSRGHLVILPSSATKRPRVPGVVLELREGRAPDVSLHPGFRVQYRSPAR